MRKETYTNNLDTIYDPTRRGAKYSIDGGNHYMNGGEYCECVGKSVLGYEPKKAPNDRYDKAYDIPELEASMKSWNCGLTDRKDMPKNHKDFMRKFWRTEKCQNFIWVYVYENMVDIWYMNRKEFQKFVRKFASWDNYCEKVRIKTCNNKINAWLEAQL